MKKYILASMLTLPLALSTALAQEASSGPTLKISGYGTGALTWTDTNDAQFARPNQASGAGTRPTTGVDSNLGLQADLAINDWLSVTAQGLVRKDAQEGFGAEVSWAFLKAKATDNLSFRIGRVGFPIFMISDYRNVGYANTMMRAPSEVYSQVPIDSIDGVDATWQQSFGDTTVTAQLVAGGAHLPMAANGTVIHVDGSGMTALNVVAEHGPLTLRVSRADAKISLRDSAGLNTLIGALRQVGAGYHISALTEQADALQVEKKKTSFTSAGMMLDWNNIVLQSEYVKLKTDRYSADRTGWYAMAGYRFGKFLPYYSHAKTSVDHAVDNIVPTSCPAAYGPACTPTVAALHAGVDQASRAARQSTDTIGLRWDAFRSAAIKFQVDRVKPEGGAGLLLSPQPGFTGPVTVGAVAIDFVF